VADRPGGCGRHAVPAHRHDSAAGRSGAEARQRLADKAARQAPGPQRAEIFTGETAARTSRWARDPSSRRMRLRCCLFFPVDSRRLPDRIPLGMPDRMSGLTGRRR